MSCFPFRTVRTQGASMARVAEAEKENVPSPDSSGFRSTVPFDGQGLIPFEEHGDRFGAKGDHPVRCRRIKLASQLLQTLAPGTDCVRAAWKRGRRQRDAGLVRNALYFSSAKRFPGDR